MKIALVQFYSYHEEVLAPQIDYLLPDTDVYVAAPSVVFDNAYIKIFDNKIKRIEFSNKKYNEKNILHFGYRLFSIINKYFQLNASVKKNDINLIIFNTINRAFHFFLINLFFLNIGKIHIIHNAQLYLTPKSVKKLAVFIKNLFISRDVYQNYIDSRKFIDLSSFGWFFPNLLCLTQKQNTGPSCNDAITIVIPGSVDNSRRNYNGLYSSLKSASLVRLLTGNMLNIILLGKITPEETNKIKEVGLDTIIKTYIEYVGGEEMLSTIQNADAVAFLVDRTIGENINLYNKYKASGTSALALSFGVPCIVSSDFTVDKALETRTIIYPGTEIEKVFINIAERKINKDYFRKLKQLPLPSEYSYKQAREHYRKIVGLGNDRV